MSTAKKSKKITLEHRALREMRLSKNLGLEEAALPLGIKSKALGHIENGRVKLTRERIEKIIFSLGFSYYDFIRVRKKIKDDKINRTNRKVIRSVLKNTDRRHYQKIITKDVRVLKNFRKMKNLSQDEASKICGYSRATIGHIENGRIELSKERIDHISMCYGFTYSDFENQLGVVNLREETIDYCSRNLKSLSDEKLNLIKTMIDSLGGN